MKYLESKLPQWLRRLKMDTQNSHHFLGFDIPLDLLMLTGGGPETFDETTYHHRNLLFRFLNLKLTDVVLELGCGVGRDAIHLAKLQPSVNQYIGIDIIKNSIIWAQLNITSKFPNFKFYHNDVQDQLHNPEGVLQVSEISLPAHDNTVDKIFLWSVFTHMSEETIKHYLQEFKRVLKFDGLVFCSCFIVDQKVLESASKVNLTPYDLKFEFSYSHGCFVNNLEFPMGAVSYTESKIDEILESCGLERKTEFFRGAWSGYWENPIDGQDGFCFGIKD
jgi:SAM-dependent methyltransferase